VFARAVDGRILYVNTTNEPKDVALDGQRTGVLSGTSWQGTLHLAPYGVDLVQ
jgi:beta-galactosidase